MKEMLLQLAKYNLWANKRILALALAMDEELLDKEILSSFSSIRDTVYHTWGAEFIWLQRLQLAENPIWIPDTFKGSFPEACADWQKVSQVLIDFVAQQYDDRALEHVVQYYTTDKKSFKNPVFEILQHVFNHATYHRGQLVTMLRQVGQKKIPATDYMIYLRR